MTRSEYRAAFFQIIRFGIVGVSNTLISYITFVVLVLLSVHYLWANVVSFVVGVLNAFYWSNRYVFIMKENEYRPMIPTLVKTFLSYGFTGILLASLLLFFLVEHAGASAIIAQLIVLSLTVPLNFLLNKYWTFNSSNKP